MKMRQKQRYMMMQENIIDEIAKIKDVLPKKQQKLCHYLVMNYEQVGVMTVAELAEAAGVGTTTVMRLVQTLDYPSFSAFKKDLLNAALMRTTTSYRGLKQSFNDRRRLFQRSDVGRDLYARKFGNPIQPAAV